MKRKLLLSSGVIAACILVLVVGIYSFQPINQSSGELPGTSEQLRVRGYVTVDVYRPVGGEITLIYHYESHNVITDLGLRVFERCAAGSTGTWNWTVAQGGNNKFYRATAPTYIALSSDGTGVNASHSSWQAVDGSYPVT